MVYEQKSGNSTKVWLPRPKLTHSTALYNFNCKTHCSYFTQNLESGCLDKGPYNVKKKTVRDKI